MRIFRGNTIYYWRPAGAFSAGSAPADETGLVFGRQKSIQRGVTLGVALCAALLLAPSARGQSGPVAWVAPSLQRVEAAQQPGSAIQAQLAAARGEYESFQIVVSAPAGNNLTNVNVAVSDLASSGGQVISKSNLALFREHYMYVSSSSPDWGGSNRPLGPGWYADALIPFVDPVTGAPPAGGTLRAVPFSVPAGQNQPVWVDVFVPPGAVGGQYAGAFTVTSDQGSAGGQISLRVWNFTLPLKSSLKSSFAFFQANTLAGQQELLRNKVSPLNVGPLDELGLMNNFGLGSTNTGFWSGADIGSCSMSPAPSVVDFQAASALHQPGVYLFDYSADEVGNCSNLYPTIQQWARNMHQAGIDNLITMAPVSALLDDGSGTGRSAVDVWVVLPSMYNNAAGTVQQALAKGDEVWSYNTLVQDSYSPKWEIDFAPINFRIQPGFINQSLGLSGLLYWRVDLWSSDPWNNINNTGMFSSSNYPGEGVLVYPGETVGIAGVAPSIRLKWIRDGVEDYEYVEMLKKAGYSSLALQIANSVAPDWTNWTRDPNALEDARRQLGAQLDTLSGGSSGTPPSAPGGPSPADGAAGVSATLTLSWAVASNATSYDVYLGTSSTPPFAGTTSGTSYSPGALGSSTKYYWRVVAKNSDGAASSSTWSFTTDASGSPRVAPLSVTPSSGTGLSQTFTFAFFDSNGYSDLGGVNVLFNGTFSGTNGCWLYYDVAARTVWLARDDASAWDSLPAGSASTLENGQCSISVGQLKVRGSRTTLKLRVPVTFKSAFGGTKTTYLRASSKTGVASDYVPLGTWTVLSALTSQITRISNTLEPGIR